MKIIRSSGTPWLMMTSTAFIAEPPVAGSCKAMSYYAQQPLHPRQGTYRASDPAAIHNGPQCLPAANRVVGYERSFVYLNEAEEQPLSKIASAVPSPRPANTNHDN